MGQVQGREGGRRGLSGLGRRGGRYVQWDLVPLRRGVGFFDLLSVVFGEKERGGDIDCLGFNDGDTLSTQWSCWPLSLLADFSILQRTGERGPVFLKVKPNTGGEI